MRSANLARRGNGIKCRFRGLEIDPDLANFRSAGPGRSVGRALRSLQGQHNFADEPLIAPIKTHLTAKLATIIFSKMPSTCALAKKAVKTAPWGQIALFKTERFWLFSGLAAPNGGRGSLRA
jgi:hypothetical protein